MYTIYIYTYPFIKGLYPTDSVKYFRIKSDSILYWKSHINTIPARLNGAYAMLYKVSEISKRFCQ